MPPYKFTNAVFLLANGLKMQKLIYFLSLCFLITACNDGNIIEVELDFDKTLSLCDLSPGDYFLYDTKKNPSESLSLIFPKNSATDLIFNPTENNYKTTFPINGTNSKFNYRTYDGNPEDLLCNLLPDPATHLTNDYAATSGTVTTTSTFVDDEGDGTHFNRTVMIKFYIQNVNLEIISLTEIYFGTYTQTLRMEIE